MLHEIDADPQWHKARDYRVIHISNPRAGSGYVTFGFADYPADPTCSPCLWLGRFYGRNVLTRTTIRLLVLLGGLCRCKAIIGKDDAVGRPFYVAGGFALQPNGDMIRRIP